MYSFIFHVQGLKEDLYVFGVGIISIFCHNILDFYGLLFHLLPLSRVRAVKCSMGNWMKQSSIPIICPNQFILHFAMQDFCFLVY